MEAFDLGYMLSLFPILLKYLEVTLGMALIGAIFALALAVSLTAIRIFKVPGLNSIVVVFISFFRGTPLLVQLFLLYYGLPQIFPLMVGIDAFSCAVLGLSLHFSSYMSESLRAAINSVAKNQWEAGLAFGLSRLQTLKRIIFPQALRTALPSLMNYFIDMLKSTSLAFSLGVAEIMAKAQMEAAGSFKYFEAFLAVALIYWALVAIFTQLQHLLEKHLSKAY
jgi:putative amino-acid transport system permease protein